MRSSPYPQQRHVRREPLVREDKFILRLFFAFFAPFCGYSDFAPIRRRAHSRPCPRYCQEEPIQRFDPDLYRVTEGENTLGEAETVEDEDDKRGGSHLWAGEDGTRRRRTKQRISVGSPAPAANLSLRNPLHRPGPAKGNQLKSKADIYCSCTTVT